MKTNRVRAQDARTEPKPQPTTGPDQHAGPALVTRVFNDMDLLPMREMVALGFVMWPGADPSDEDNWLEEWTVAEWRLLKAAAAEMKLDVGGLVDHLLRQTMMSYARRRYESGEEEVTLHLRHVDGEVKEITYEREDLEGMMLEAERRGMTLGAVYDEALAAAGLCQRARKAQEARPA